MYPKDPKHPVLQCEEFEPYDSPVPTRAATREEPQPGASDEAPAPAGLKGLCANCGNRNDCEYPKPEGGVWHCEEYV